MKLRLDYTQRLNLHAFLGAQRADRGSIRAIWAIQGRIALDAQGERGVELKREFVAGQVMAAGSHYCAGNRSTAHRSGL